jgi:hypothetical protein
MNEQFSQLIQQLLNNHFNEKILEEINFRGPSGLIDIVIFDGCTISLKKFWGRFKLADKPDLIDWIEINIEGNFYRFFHYLEIEEPFVRN